MGGGHQRPFPVLLLQPSLQEKIYSSGRFDLPEHWLHNRFVQGIDRLDVDPEN